MRTGIFRKLIGTVKPFCRPVHCKCSSEFRYRRKVACIHVQQVARPLLSCRAVIAKVHPWCFRIIWGNVNSISHIGTGRHLKRLHVLVKHKSCNAAAVICTQVLIKPCRLLRHSVQPSSVSYDVSVDCLYSGIADSLLPY